MGDIVTTTRYKVSFSSDEIFQFMVIAAQFCEYMKKH